MPASTVFKKLATFTALFITSMSMKLVSLAELFMVGCITVVIMVLSDYYQSY